MRPSASAAIRVGWFCPPAVRRAGQRLGSVLEPADRPTQPPSRPHHREVLRPRLAFAAERTADVGHDDADLLGSQPEAAGQVAAKPMRRLV